MNHHLILLIQAQSNIVCCCFNIIVHINNIVSRESDLIYLHTATLSCFGILEVQADWPFYE